MADWSELAQDVLELITSKLELSDYHRFGAVCQNWQAATKAKHYHPANHLPWLILGEDANTKKRVFFSLSEKKHYYMDIAELYGHFCLGSSYGWLFTVDEEIDGHLLNPLTHEHYELPPFPADSSLGTPEDFKALNGKRRSRIQCHIVRKAILSDNPSKTQDFTLVILFGFPHTVVFWSPGDPKWSVVKTPYSQIQDVTFFKGTLYGLIGCYYPVIVDLGPDRKMTRIRPFVRSTYVSREGSLVNFDDEFLLLIHRIEADCEGSSDEDSDIDDDDEDHHFVTKELRVFELDLEKGKYLKRRNINGSAFFLGRGSHVVTDPAQVAGCVRNRISYSGIMNDCKGFSDVGFYDMVSKTIGEYNPCEVLIHHEVSPTWFTPNPW